MITLDKVRGAQSQWLSDPVKVPQWYLTLCKPKDFNLPDSSVHGIFQARILSGLPFPFPGDLPNPGIKPRSSALQAGSLPFEPPGKPQMV